MSDTPDRVEHLFVVRIWQEGGSAGWRGSVEHVPSAQRLYFASLRDLSDFITLRLRGPGEAAAGPPSA